MSGGVEGWRRSEASPIPIRLDKPSVSSRAEFFDDAGDEGFRVSEKH